GDCHAPLPCEVRGGKNTTSRACSLAVQGGLDAGYFDLSLRLKLHYSRLPGRPRRWTSARRSAFPFGPLRARRERPHCCAAEQRDELAAFHPCAHSITSSATASSVGGTSRPRAFAVLRLMTSSNFVGCTTGRSAGLSPFRIRPA